MTTGKRYKYGSKRFKARVANPDQTDKYGVARRQSQSFDTEAEAQRWVDGLATVGWDFNATIIDQEDGEEES